MTARDEGQLTLPGFGLMEITLTCRNCRAVVQDYIAIGSSAKAFLEKYGWVSVEKGFLCEKCKVILGSAQR